MPLHLFSRPSFMKFPAILCLLVLSLCPVAAAPVKVFILAGQSNMEGQAVVDLEGKDYNEGRGILTTLMADPAKAAMLQHLFGALDVQSALAVVEQDNARSIALLQRLGFRQASGSALDAFELTPTEQLWLLPRP